MTGVTRQRIVIIKLTRYRTMKAAMTRPMNGKRDTQKVPPSLTSSVALGIRPCIASGGTQGSVNAMTPCTTSGDAAALH